MRNFRALGLRAPFVAVQAKGRVAPAANQIEGRLIQLAALFLAVYSLALSLAPAARLRTWDTPLRLDHWIAFVVWLVVANLAHIYLRLWLPDRDPYLMPAALLLTGWGTLTIWRLFPAFGLRQTVWLAVAGALLILGMRLPSSLSFIRRYKYIWLTSGLLLTGTTLVFGVNPMGEGPRMWLSCCGLYLQPSEPLKLLLIGYLAAYLADSAAAFTPRGTPLLPLLAPTLLMTGMALLLLAIQRDLGAASIFVFLYTAMIFLASGRRRIAVFGLVATLVASVAGYLLFDVVRVRVDAWLNPWLDPSGRSYQIVQSLMAVANGGLLGRGPGLGSPGLVPVSHSDFVFTTIAEEMGLAGSLGLLLLIAVITTRGLRAALRAPDTYRRYLAAGLVTFLTAQSVLIIGGNVRLLPLTGVTLPFVSYGGSSLVTSYLSLLLLLHISNQPESQPAPLPNPRPFQYLHTFLMLGLAAAALICGYWAVVRSSELGSRLDNPRRAVQDLYVRRGAILDRNNRPLVATEGEVGEYTRHILLPSTSNTIGYTHPYYGQSGLEASLDDILRGLTGYPSPTVAWTHLLYGQTPPGINVRLSLDLALQQQAEAALKASAGALVLLNARSGEILAIASSPTFDANRLDETWTALVGDEKAPLLNRATQGLYPPGAALGPFLLAAAQAAPQAEFPSNLSFTVQSRQLDCAITPPAATWAAAVRAGCPGAAAALGSELGSERLRELYTGLGLYTAPAMRLPTASLAPPTSPYPDPAAAALGQTAPDGETSLAASPLQMALAAAALTNNGLRPNPTLVLAYNHPEQGWVSLPPQNGAQAQAGQALQPAAATSTLRLLGQATASNGRWETVAVAPTALGGAVTWYMAGTLPGAADPPLVLVLVLEEAAPEAALEAGATLFEAASSQ